MLLLLAPLFLSAAFLKEARAAKGPLPQAEAMEVETVTVSATIMGVNFLYRTVTLAGSDGKLRTYKVSREVVNFDQLHPYDVVKVTAIDSLAVFLRKSDAPASAGEADSVALAPKGALPGGVIAESKEVTAKISAVNRRSRQVTLNFVGGDKRTVKVHRSVDLAGVRAGDDVTVRLTEALAVVVEKP